MFKHSPYMDNLKNFRFDYVFVATIYLDIDDNYFNGGAEIHLRHTINTIKSLSNTILVIQHTSGPTTLLKKDGIYILKLYAKNSFFYKFKLRHLLSIIETKWVHFNYLGLDNYIKKKRNATYSGITHGIAWDFPSANLPAQYMGHPIYISLGSLYKKASMFLADRHSLRRLDKIISVDTGIIRLAQFFITKDRNKITVVKNFVDTKKFMATKKSPPSTGKPLLILYPRNISIARGVHLLNPIANILKAHGLNFRIQLVGAAISQIGASKYERIFQDEIKKNGNEKFFELLGRVEHNKMPKYFAEADLIIIPTFFSEGTSLSCLEAMASGKTVIASNIGGLNDLILDGYNGFLVIPHPQAIAYKILELAENSLQRESIGKAALNLTQKVYTKERWEQAIRCFFSPPTNM